MTNTLHKKILMYLFSGFIYYKHMKSKQGFLFMEEFLYPLLPEVRRTWTSQVVLSKPHYLERNISKLSSIISYAICITITSKTKHKMVLMNYETEFWANNVEISQWLNMDSSMSNYHLGSKTKARAKLDAHNSWRAERWSYKK